MLWIGLQQLVIMSKCITEHLIQPTEKQQSIWMKNHNNCISSEQPNLVVAERMLKHAAVNSCLVKTETVDGTAIICICLSTVMENQKKQLLTTAIMTRKH